MRILFLTPWYPYKDSGVNHGIFVRDQAVAVGSEHQVVLIASKINYSKFSFYSYTREDSVFQNVEEHRILIDRSFPIYNQLNYFIITFLCTYRIAREFKPDIIHGNIGYPGAFWAFFIARLIRRPYIVTEHSGKLNGHFRSIIQKIMTIYPMRKAAKLISVSQYAANDVFYHVGKKPVIVGNIIDFTKFDFINTIKKEDIFNIGFLGVLNNNKKGLDLLLNAMPGVTGNYLLHIGGGGDLLEEYKVMAKSLGIIDRCRFYGFVAHWEVPDFLKRLQFFVNTSRFESFGMAIAEAMGVGLPVVVTDSGGPADYVNSQNGIIVPNGNPVLLGNAINQMMEKYETYNPLTISNFIKDNFSDKVFLKKMNEIYNDAVEDRRIETI